MSLLQLIILFALLGVARARALITYVDDPSFLTAPANGAPWDHVAQIGGSASGVYLGNGFVLTANHVNVYTSITPTMPVFLNNVRYDLDLTYGDQGMQVLSNVETDPRCVRSRARRSPARGAARRKKTGERKGRSGRMGCSFHKSITDSHNTSVNVRTEVKYFGRLCETSGGFSNIGARRARRRKTRTHARRGGRRIRERAHTSTLLATTGARHRRSWGGTHKK